jgi:hypothetical protein
MSIATLSNRAAAAAAAVLAVCSAGCMLEPGHDEFIGYTNEPVSFTGVLQEPGVEVEVQALHPTRGWEPIFTATSMFWSIRDRNGSWHPWMAEQRVPSEYWTDQFPGVPLYKQATLRAVVPDYDDEVLFTFEQTFPWMDAVVHGGYWAGPGPDLLEIWDRWGHGKTVTIYGQLEIRVRAP